MTEADLPVEQNSLAVTHQLLSQEITPTVQGVQVTGIDEPVVAITDDSNPVTFVVHLRIGQATRDMNLTVNFQRSINENKLAQFAAKDIAMTEAHLAGAPISNLDTLVADAVITPPRVDLPTPTVISAVISKAPADADTRTQTVDFTLGLGTGRITIPVALSYVKTQNEADLDRLTAGNFNFAVDKTGAPVLPADISTDATATTGSRVSLQDLVGVAPANTLLTDVTIDSVTAAAFTQTSQDIDYSVIVRKGLAAKTIVVRVHYDHQYALTMLEGLTQADFTRKPVAGSNPSVEAGSVPLSEDKGLYTVGMKDVTVKTAELGLDFAPDAKEVSIILTLTLEKEEVTKTFPYTFERSAQDDILAGLSSDVINIGDLAPSATRTFPPEPSELADALAHNDANGNPVAGKVTLPADIKGVTVAANVEIVSIEYKRNPGQSETNAVIVVTLRNKDANAHTPTRSFQIPVAYTESKQTNIFRNLTASDIHVEGEKPTATKDGYLETTYVPVESDFDITKLRAETAHGDHLEFETYIASYTDTMANFDKNSATVMVTVTVTIPGANPRSFDVPVTFKGSFNQGIVDSVRNDQIVPLTKVTGQGVIDTPHVPNQLMPTDFTAIKAGPDLTVVEIESITNYVPHQDTKTAEYDINLKLEQATRTIHVSADTTAHPEAKAPTQFKYSTLEQDFLNLDDQGIRLVNLPD